MENEEQKRATEGQPLEGQEQKSGAESVGPVAGKIFQVLENRRSRR